MAITFDVSPVERAKTPLIDPLDPDELHPEHPTERRVMLGQPVEAWGSNVERCLPVGHHGLLATIHAAFDRHYPLVLTPDTIWLAIAQGFAIHVKENAEQLRGKFVRHIGQTEIKVRRDDFVKDSPANPWPEVFQAFSDQIRERIGRQRDLVVCDFSTTGPCERAASEIVLMEAMQQYFKFVLVTRCGIPAITLEGTVDDWRSIARRVSALGEYELGWWVAALQPVVDKLVLSAEGQPDIDFWQSFFKLDNMSGGPYVTGWINAFFPYCRDGKRGFRRSPWIERRYKTPIGNIPSGLAVAPFIWDYLGTNYPMEFLGGFVGIAQDDETLALRPAIGWAVRDASTPVDDGGRSAGPLERG